MTNGIHNPAQELDPLAVREQLDRILSSASFRNSKRHSCFLRYIVEESLDGRSAQLKERTVGVQVFGRTPEYDSNLDPIVRVSAGELRKRIAQYYHEPGRDGEIRIDLPPGSYVPEFRSPSLAPALAPEPLLAPPAPAAARRLPRLKPAYLFAAGAALALIGLTIWLFAQRQQPAFSQFWEPVWNSPGTVVISIPGRQSADLPASQPANPPRPQTLAPPARPLPTRVALSDAMALACLTPVLKSKGKEFRILTESATTLADLKGGPVILIGAFSNELTLQLMSQARFTFTHDPDTNLPWIRDRQNPSSRQWEPDRRLVDASAGYTDYAVISRILDPATDRVAVVAAGISGAATLAASEFLSNPRNMEEITRQAPKDWSAMNLQVVLALKTSGGKPDPPRVLATYFW